MAQASRAACPSHLCSHLCIVYTGTHELKVREDPQRSTAAVPPVPIRSSAFNAATAAPPLRATLSGPASDGWLHRSVATAYMLTCVPTDT
jgi:hypothetical protein